MWIVNIALRRPYTFIVAALLILLSTPYVLRKMPTDIFPEIKRVVLMQGGRIVADGPKAKVLSSTALSRLFGRRVRLIRRGNSFDLVRG